MTHLECNPNNKINEVVLLHIHKTLFLLVLCLFVPCLLQNTLGAGVTGVKYKGFGPNYVFCAVIHLFTYNTSKQLLRAITIIQSTRDTVQKKCQFSQRNNLKMLA